MKRFLYLSLSLLIILSSVSGSAMTIRVEATPELLPGLIQVGQPFTIDIYMENSDTVSADPINGYRLSYSTPYAFYSPDGSISNIVHIDTGGWGPTGNLHFLNGFDGFWEMFFDVFPWSYDGSLPDSLNITGIGSNGWPNDLGEQLYIQFYFQGNEEGTFCIDSIGGQTSTFDWLLDDPSPPFGGPYCWEIGNMPTDPEIGVSLDSISFAGLAGGSPPSAQTLSISNTGVGTLNWTASWNSSWLSVSPPFGTAPSIVQVFANPVGMSSGIYYDTITISDPTATNNPVLIPVALTLTEPPSIIILSDDSFNFFAIADSTDPDDQFLTVSNGGGGALSWTATNTESWLSLAPGSGGDGATITLAIDITGLAYGIYYDTVVISDPSASNSPQKAEVKLEIASSLPLLGVDQSFIFVAINTGDPRPDDKQFLVFNEGAGSMNYYLTETSAYIISMTPDSGAVPQTVTVAFDSIPGTNGQNFFDTVMVYSDEASNSPLSIVFQFHYSDSPAHIIASKDTLVIDLYECGQGINPPALPNLTVYNGGGEPFDYDVEYSQEWLTVFPPSGTAPQILYFTVDYRSLSVGTYYDNLVITALNAENSPVTVPVIVNILPTDQTPEIWINVPDTFVFTTQEERVGNGYFTSLNNKNPGCFDWAVQENIPWLSYHVDSVHGSTYPWNIGFMPNAFGVPWGEYNDSAFIVSSTASNSPLKLNFRVYVWKFHGDLNYDGVINIFDIGYLIKYLYQNGPGPIPEFIVGDCDCSYTVDIFDITEIIDYLYNGAGPLCGNPY